MAITPLPHTWASATCAGVGAPAKTAAEGVASGARVLVAVWCCSVGATWTVELYELDAGATLGSLADWISSGVPTSQPEPGEASVRTLLADRGLNLYPDSAVGPCGRSRRGIGYVCDDAELIAAGARCADALNAMGGTARSHPATQWELGGPGRSPFR